MPDSDVTIYGLKNCDTCRKAVQAFKQVGREVFLCDVRSVPLDPEVLAHWHSLFGNALVNTRSTTWRGLSSEERDSAPVALLLAHPALMKRPVIVAGSDVTLGWTAAVREKLLPDQ